MTGKLGLWRLFHWLGRRPAPCGHEPADVGTAFGMEMFLDSTEGERAVAEGLEEPESALPRWPRHPTWRT